MEQPVKYVGIVNKSRNGAVLRVVTDVCSSCQRVHSQDGQLHSRPSLRRVRLHSGFCPQTVVQQMLIEFMDSSYIRPPGMRDTAKRGGKLSGESLAGLFHFHLRFLRPLFLAVVFADEFENRSLARVAQTRIE